MSIVPSCHPKAVVIVKASTFGCVSVCSKCGRELAKGAAEYFLPGVTK